MDNNQEHNDIVVFPFNSIFPSRHLLFLYSIFVRFFSRLTTSAFVSTENLVCTHQVCRKSQGKGDIICFGLSNNFRRVNVTIWGTTSLNYYDLTHPRTVPDPTPVLVTNWYIHDRSADSQIHSQRRRISHSVCAPIYNENVQWRQCCDALCCWMGDDWCGQLAH